MSLDAELAATGEWECMECGYIEQGVKTKHLKVCPDCGAPSQALEFFPFGDDADADWGNASEDEASDDDPFDGEDEDLR